MSRHSHIIPTLLLSFVVYFVTNLGVIWSIAWCFVPPGTGGPFMRQRVGQVTQIIVGFLDLIVVRNDTSFLWIFVFQDLLPTL